ncbi:MAG: hypothetical protein AAFR38_05540 [Planctomycetota bacterium]
MHIARAAVAALSLAANAAESQTGTEPTGEHDRTTATASLAFALEFEHDGLDDREEDRDDASISAMVVSFDV